MQWWQLLTVAAWRLLDQHGQLAAFVFLLVEEAGTPIPIPGDFLMVLVGARAAQGHLRLIEVLVVMELATVLGASLLYFVSARAGRRVVYRLGRHIGLTPPRLDQMGQELLRRGASAVILGRLTPGLRIATPIVCGIFRFPFRVYLPAMALGGFLYILAYTLLGFFFGPHVLRFLETFELPLGLLASGALLAALTVWTLRIGRLAPPAEGRPQLGERLWAGAASGLLATLISSLLANVLIHLFGLLAFRAPAAALAQLLELLSEEIGRAPGLAAASLLLPALLMVGSALGALYGAWFGKTVSAHGPLRGVLFALLPLTVSLLIVLPFFGAGPAGLGLHAGLVPALGETVRHVAYGLVLGTLYPALARPRQPRAKRPTPSAGAEAESRVAEPAAEASVP